MKTIEIKENQFYDINAPEYKLSLEFHPNEIEITFSVVVHKDNAKDEMIEEIHLNEKQIVSLASKLNNFLLKK